jgi:hypothetical protein
LAVHDGERKGGVDVKDERKDQANAKNPEEPGVRQDGFADGAQVMPVIAMTAFLPMAEP